MKYDLTLCLSTVCFFFAFVAANHTEASAPPNARINQIEASQHDKMVQAITTPSVDRPGRVLQGKTFIGEMVIVEEGDTFEACTFIQCQLRVIGVDDVLVRHNDFRDSTVHVENTSDTQIVSNRWSGVFMALANSDVEHHRDRGARAAITGEGQLRNLAIYKNHFIGVSRSILLILNHGDFRNIQTGWNLSAGQVRSNLDFNTGESFLIHGSIPGTQHKVVGFTSVRDTWIDWSPVDHNGDFHWVKGNPGAWKKAAIHFHDASAIGILIIRPRLGREDVLRFVASDYWRKAAIERGLGKQEIAKIKDVTISQVVINRPAPDRGAISAFGNVSISSDGGMQTIDFP